jgi:hypothetical protein
MPLWELQEKRPRSGLEEGGKIVHRAGRERGVSTSLVALLLLLGLLVGSEAAAWLIVRPDTALTRAVTLALGLGLFAVVFLLALVAASAKD